MLIPCRLLFCRLSNARSLYAIKLNRFYSSDKKQESYFSAIGGESDEPPPDLTPQQVKLKLIISLQISNAIINLKLSI
jgi:hypothetical protein